MGRAGSLAVAEPTAVAGLEEDDRTRRADAPQRPAGDGAARRGLDRARCGADVGVVVRAEGPERREQRQTRQQDDECEDPGDRVVDDSGAGQMGDLAEQIFVRGPGLGRVVAEPVREPVEVTLEPVRDEPLRPVTPRMPT